MHPYTNQGNLEQNHHICIKKQFSTSISFYNSVSLRYCAISTILVNTKPCCLQNLLISGNLIICVGCSSLTISHKTPHGFCLASLDKSIAASVWPSRSSVPPALARRGNM
mmetsp:Transcript_1517/g.1623  ORF Transcript_1517/g.1623 Transcript_1517/m.1623 type:complete len:110 (-) Transcript_1517:874-1203(-)